MNALTNISLGSDAENIKRAPICYLSQSNVETMQKVEEQLTKIKRLNIDIVHMNIQLGEHREYVKERTLTHENRNKLYPLHSYKINTSFLTKRIAFMSQELAKEIKILGNLLINRSI